MGFSLEDTTAAVPLGRAGDSRDIAEMVAYLASARAQCITGSNFVLDGGEHPAAFVMSHPVSSHRLASGSTAVAFLTHAEQRRSRAADESRSGRFGERPSERHGRGNADASTLTGTAPAALEA